MSRVNNYIGLLVGLIVLTLAITIRSYDPTILATLRGAGFDTLQSIWPRNPIPAQPVRIVDIDEASLKSIGQWPWPRNELATLVTNLTALGASAIAFDIIFAEPDRMSPSALGRNPEFAKSFSAEALASLADNDKLLAEAIAQGPVVSAFASTTGTQTNLPPSKAGFAQTGQDATNAPPHLAKIVSNIEILDSSAKGLGSINIDLAGDQGIARQVPLLWSDGKTLYPSLILESLRIAQQAESYVVNGSDSSENVIESIRVGDIEIPTSESGLLQVNYRANEPALYVSAEKLLRQSDLEALRPLIEGHIVLIGTSAVGLLDTRISALGESIPGVSVHAQALEQILSGAFLSRPEWLVGSEFVVTLVLGLLIATLANYLRPAATIFTTGLALAALAGVTAIAFRNFGLLVDITFPAAALLLTFLSTTAFKLLVTDRHGRHLRRSFAHYVAPSVLAEIERNPQDLKLGGEIRDVTVMFVDIKNFTPLSERLAPQELVTIINGVLDACSKAILIEGGTIDKYIGDAVMAFWNAPVAIPEHQYHALLASLKIAQHLEAYNAQPSVKSALQAIASWPISVRIGMATGPACIGNMGSEHRFNYTVLGDAVNTAARAESAGKTIGYDCILAGDVEGQSHKLAIVSVGAVPMKGKAQDTPVHVILGDEDHATSPAFLSFKSSYVDLLQQRGTPESKTVWQQNRAALQAAFPNYAMFIESSLT